MADVVVSIGGSTAELDRTVGQTLNSFGKLSSQAAGRARVFTSALSLMESQGSKTGAVLGSVLGGFAAGGVLGLAIGGLNALVGLFRGMSEEQEKALKKSTEWGDELNKQIQRNRDDLFLLWAEMEGGAAAVARARAAIAKREAEETVAKARAELAAVQADIDATVEGMTALDTWRGRGDVPLDETTVQRREQATKNLAAAEQHLQEVEAIGAVRVGQVNRQEAEKRAAERAKEAAERSQLAAEAHIWATEEYNAAVEAIEKITEAEEKAREEEHAAEEAANEEALEMEQFWADERVRIAEETSARVQRALQPVGNALSNLISDVVVEQKDGFAALEAMAKSLTTTLINTLIQMSVQWIAAKIASHAAEKVVDIADVTASAGVAGARGAAAVAGIPVVGPALAAEVLATLPPTIMGSMLPLASAAGGWAVPDFGSEFPAVLHPKETVIPAWGRRALENMATMDPETAGSVTVVNNISAIDGPSTRRFVESDDYVRAVQRAIRLGRLGRS